MDANYSCDFGQVIEKNKTQISMLGNLLGGLINTEQIVHDTIQSTLEKLATEMSCSYKDLFIMIKPVDDTFTMKFWVYKLEEKGPKLIREIPLKEVLGD